MYESILSRLRKVRWHPASKMWSACCPAHDDRHPSLWLWVGDNGALVARCKSGQGCTWDAIVEAIGTKKQDWFPERERPLRPQEQNGKLVATFKYFNADGQFVYEALRYEKPALEGEKPVKYFKYRRPQPSACGWTWNLDGVEKVLYRLPELLDEGTRSQPVFVVEGEGKVEAVRKLGFVATSSPCGAGGWNRSYGRWLKRRRVVILPDNDDPGWDHAIKVAGSLIAWEAAAAIYPAPG